MHCTCTTTIRARTIDWIEGEPIHSAREGGCGGKMSTRRAIAIETARDEVRENHRAAQQSSAPRPSAPSGTNFRLTVESEEAEGTAITRVWLGNQPCESPAELWAALRANTSQVRTRQRARADKLAAERRADAERIDAAIAAGKCSTGPATQCNTAPRRSRGTSNKPKAKPGLCLADLGL